MLFLTRLGIVNALLFAVGFSASLTEASVDSCRFVFDSAPAFKSTISEFVDWSEYKRRMYIHLAGPNDSIQLTLNAKMPFPVSRHVTPENRRELNWGGKRNRDFIGRPEVESPVVAISRIVITSHFNDRRHYEAVYGNYSNVIRDQLIQQLMGIDKELEVERTSSWIVQELSAAQADDPRIFGTFRIYDGSMAPFGLQFVDQRQIHQSLIGPKPLPFQRINRSRGIEQLEVERFIESQIRAGRKVFEMGKFSLDGPVEVRSRSREIIETFFLREIVELYPDAIFVGHVASAVHARLYASRYAMKTAQKYAVEGNPDGEMIVWATGRTIAEKLRESLSMPNVGPRDVSRDRETFQLPEFHSREP